MGPSQTMPSRRTIETAVALACRAPSLHNSQPWRWVLGSQDLSLFSDPDRILPATDAFGRQMVLSCGAALNHLHYAFASLRWTSVIDRLPHSQGRQCLATIGLAPAQGLSDTDDRMATAITRRRTERLPMDPPGRWDQTFAQVTELAAQSGTHLEVIGEHGRPALEAMSRRLSGLRRADPVYQAELRWWAGHSLYPEGIPAEALPAARHRTVAVEREFPPGNVTSDTGNEDDRAAILLLSTPSDSRLDWVRCGEALSAVLLACTDRGLATCTVTHLTESGAVRTALRELSDGDGLPQVLVRVGRSTRPAPTTAVSRRPLSEILFRE
jgi:nitroreductase